MGGGAQPRLRLGSEMNDFGEWIKLLGGIAGLAALAWRMLDEFGAYLRISVKAEAPRDGWVTILTNGQVFG